MNVHDADHTLVRSRTAPLQSNQASRLAGGLSPPGLPATIWLLPASELGHRRSAGDRERHVPERFSLQRPNLPSRPRARVWSQAPLLQPLRTRIARPASGSSPAPLRLAGRSAAWRP